MHPLPPLNPLKAFEAAGRLLSVSKAAEELFVTPAAVSRQAKALEKFIGMPLFRRSATGLELTPAGARYLAELAPLFSSRRAVVHLARPLDFDRGDIDAGVELGSGEWPRRRVQRLVPHVLLPVLAPRGGRRAWPHGRPGPSPSSCRSRPAAPRTSWPGHLRSPCPSSSGSRW